MKLKERIQSYQEQAEEAKEHIACAYDGCWEPAITHKKRGNATINLCRKHDEAEHLRETKAWLAERGLNDRSKRNEFLKRVSREVRCEIL